MTDTELEELGVLLEDLRQWFNAAPLHVCPTRDAKIRGDMDKFYARVEAQCLADTTRAERIRKLEAVAEAARAKLAAEDAVNSNIAFGEHDEDAAKAHGNADKEFRAALAALEEVKP